MEQEYANNFCHSIQKHWQEREKKKKQEFGDNFSVCVLHLFP